MNSNEAKIQLNSLIEHFKHGGLDFNATDILAIETLLDENKKYKEIINKLKQFCNDKHNFLILDVYSQDDVDEIQVALLDILNEVEDNE